MMSFCYLCTGFVFSSGCKNNPLFLDEVQNGIKTILVIFQSYSKWHLVVNRGGDCEL